MSFSLPCSFWDFSERFFEGMIAQGDPHIRAWLSEEFQTERGPRPWVALRFGSLSPGPRVPRL
jgi:hypothetical protein